MSGTSQTSWMSPKAKTTSKIKFSAATSSDGTQCYHFSAASGYDDALTADDCLLLEYVAIDGTVTDLAYKPAGGSAIAAFDISLLPCGQIRYYYWDDWCDAGNDYCGHNGLKIWNCGDSSQEIWGFDAAGNYTDGSGPGSCPAASGGMCVYRPGSPWSASYSLGDTCPGTTTPTPTETFAGTATQTETITETSTATPTNSATFTVSPSPTATPTFGNCSHDVTHLSQGNPTWAATPMDSSDDTIQESGCLLTCLAMLDNTTPDLLNTSWSAKKYIHSDGQLDMYASCASLGWEYLGEAAYDPDQIVADVCGGTYVIAKVTRGNGSYPHFVVITGTVYDSSLQRERFTIADPGNRQNVYLDAFPSNGGAINAIREIDPNPGQGGN